MPQSLPTPDDDTIGYRKCRRKIKKLCEYVFSLKEGQRTVTNLLRRPILYRGQRHAWPLEPKIARSQCPLALEMAMLRELRIRSTPFLTNSRRPEGDLEWLWLGQHYGMATRLLDWTENALAALWFALDGWQEDNEPVVWALTPADRDVLSEAKLTELRKAKPGAFQEINRTSIIYPEHIHDRLRAQSGWFTLHHYDGSRFPPLETQEDFKGKLTDGCHANLLRIDIDPRYVEPLRTQLAYCGITAGSVYPDLAGLCRGITEQLPAPRKRFLSSVRARGMPGLTVGEHLQL